ncbi:hypothetical protein [Marinoscillum pacificum]|uniref:hypothetical protein n=1 Tax=Marinoscillum pacificum TaxID=392723 RepID=UPI0021573F23|nr:hypothetical protein [Marinoscillum pacificum]
MKVLFSTSFILLSLIGMSQSWSTNLSLDRDISLQHTFYIDKVVDKRAEGSFIELDPDVSVLLQFYERSIEASPQSSGVTIFLRELAVKSGTHLELNLEFYYQSQFVYEYYGDVSVSGLSGLDNALADLLQKAVVEFDVSDVAVALFQQRSVTEELDRVKTMPGRKDGYNLHTEEEEEESRNVIAVGYQIGGLNLIGFDYEYRVSDVFGVHAGVGLAGYTAGLKIHTKKHKDSSFFNLSLKDGGFGLVRTAALEYGVRIVGRNKGGFGFHGQVGLANVLYIDREYEESIFGLDGVPPVVLSMGIGVSW